ncbi:hypothetical protein ACS0TY_014654 [Phlomoides rotata]
MKMDPAHICYYEDEYSLDLLKQFQQGFPHIDQYPSDANQGLDIPPAGVPSVVLANMSFDNNFFKQVPVLFKLQNYTGTFDLRETKQLPGMLDWFDGAPGMLFTKISSQLDGSLLTGKPSSSISVPITEIGGAGSSFADHGLSEADPEVRAIIDLEALSFGFNESDSPSCKLYWTSFRFLVDNLLYAGRFDVAVANFDVAVVVLMSFDVAVAN